MILSYVKKIEEIVEDKIIRTRENLIANNMIDADAVVRVDELLKPKPADLNKAEAAIFNEIKGYKKYKQSDSMSLRIICVHLVCMKSTKIYLLVLIVVKN